MKLVKITVLVPEKKRQEIKIICAAKRMSMQLFLDEAVHQYIQKLKNPFAIESSKDSE